MTLAIFAIVLFAAALHAVWNAIVKGAGDRLMATVLVTGAAALISLPILPFIAAPDPSSWPFIAISTLLQIAYFALVARTYDVAEMAEAYPLMRGTAPMLVAVAGYLLLDEPLPPLAWAGIGLIGIGILSMAAGRRRSGGGPGMVLALGNAVVIAAYTLIDGAGVRRSEAPAAYTLWIFLLTGIPFLLWAWTTRRQRFCRALTADWHFGLIGGIGTLTSYGLALWAMTVAPIAVIAALRETSILFGMAISALVLREPVTRPRLLGAGVILAGAIALRLA